MNKLKSKKLLYLILALVGIWIASKLIAFLVGVIGGILIVWYGLACIPESMIFIVLFVISIIIIIKTPSIIRNLKLKISEEKNKMI